MMNMDGWLRKIVSCTGYPFLNKHEVEKTEGGKNYVFNYQLIVNDYNVFVKLKPFNELMK